MNKKSLSISWGYSLSKKFHGNNFEEKRSIYECCLGFEENRSVLSKTRVLRKGKTETIKFRYG